MLIRLRRPWEIPERLATSLDTYLNRRRLLQGAGLALLGAGQAPDPRAEQAPAAAGGRANQGVVPVARNPGYTLDRPLTDESVASRFNVFDEFSVDHSAVWQRVGSFEISPWKIHVGGLVEKPLTLDVDEIRRRFSLEERLYRHRCVEAWAMAVPWTGLPFQRFIDHVRPLATARFVRMVSFARPEQAPGWYASRRVFPYYEGLSLAEATNELAFLATGIYGHPLPAQHGAPIRLVVPWKWGLKSIKSIVAFQFTQERPGTFWNDLSPGYYNFECNVDPTNFPGPWSQREEKMLGTGDIRPTLPYNGYAEQVRHLYGGGG